uniref:Uncharacterized protein n=1 Tax=Salix viminalis TaxID=40686 RepID=A0A6N2KTK2_SALVM
MQRGISSTSCTDTDLAEQINWGGRQVDNLILWTAAPLLYPTFTCSPLNGPDSPTFRKGEKPNETPINTKHPRVHYGGYLSQEFRPRLSPLPLGIGSNLTGSLIPRVEKLML